MSDELSNWIHGVASEMEAEKLSAQDLSMLEDSELAFLAFGDDPELLAKTAGTAMQVTEGARKGMSLGKRIAAGVGVGAGTGLAIVGAKKIHDDRKKKASVDVPGNVTYDGDVNTGESGSPTWPRAAMGVEAAGRKATGAEEKQQNDTSTQQHETPKTSFFKSAKEEKTHEKGTLRRIQESYPKNMALGATGGALAGAVGGRGMQPRGKSNLLGSAVGAGLGAVGGAIGGAANTAVMRPAYRGIDKLRGSKGVDSKSKDKEKEAGVASKVDRALGEAVHRVGQQASKARDAAQRGAKQVKREGSYLLRQVGEKTEDTVKDIAKNPDKRHLAIGTAVTGTSLAGANKLRQKADKTIEKAKNKTSALLAAVETHTA